MDSVLHYLCRISTTQSERSRFCGDKSSLCDIIDKVSVGDYIMAFEYVGPHPSNRKGRIPALVYKCSDCGVPTVIQKDSYKHKHINERICLCFGSNYAPEVKRVKLKDNS